MTPQQPSPFTLARLMRAYAEALQRHDLLAKEIAAETDLNQADAALNFHRISSGVPRCQYRPHHGTCTNDGRFAVSSDHNQHFLKVVCQIHLQAMAPTRCELVASLDEGLPRYARKLQELQRLIRHDPKLAATCESELQEIRRRLRPNNFHTNNHCPHQPRRPA